MSTHQIYDIVPNQPKHVKSRPFLTILLFDPFYCSGMPECKLGLNDRVLLEAQGRATKGKAIDLEDIKFHQYVFKFLLY
jgi:hypothetical protein